MRPDQQWTARTHAQPGEAPRRPGRRRRDPGRSALGDVSVPTCRFDVPSCELRKGLEDLLDRQPALQVGHHGCYRDAGAGKHRLVAEDLAVPLDPPGVAAAPPGLGGLADPRSVLIERKRDRRVNDDLVRLPVPGPGAIRPLEQQLTTGYGEAKLPQRRLMSLSAEELNDLADATKGH